MSATFELERFAWEDGAFEVAGRWRADSARGLGRARLVVEVDGRRRRIGAQGGKQASAAPEGADWRARFQCARRPERLGPAELEVGGDLVIDLPKPELPDKEPVLGPPPPDVRGAEALLEQLRSERAELEAAAKRLAQQREAAEAAAKRLAEERSAAEAAARASQQRTERLARDVAEGVAKDVAERVVRESAPPPPPPRPVPVAARADSPPPIAPRFATDTPRREAIREALSRPREPKGVLPLHEPGHQRELAYALAGLIVILVAVLLVLLL
jgi:hypothetical protein